MISKTLGLWVLAIVGSMVLASNGHADAGGQLLVWGAIGSPFFAGILQHMERRRRLKAEHEFYASAVAEGVRRIAEGGSPVKGPQR